VQISHLHIEFRDLEKAVVWMKQKMNQAPTFQNSQMAIFQINELGINFDKAATDSKITLALKSLNCDADFKSLVEKGVEVIESPNSKPYGVRSAYIQGPGQLIIEVDQNLRD